MTKEQDFKNRFVSVLGDLQENGIDDGETMWLLGSLASDLADDLKQPSWRAAKDNMGDDTYDAVLNTFQEQGTEHHRAGRQKQAYAIQAMAVSLVAKTQRSDPDMAAGEELIDQIIESARELYRKQRAAKAN